MLGDLAHTALLSDFVVLYFHAKAACTGLGGFLGGDVQLIGLGV